jgi:hypothetical protein
MKLAVNCNWGRRGARAKARSSPPCFFNLLMTSQVDQELHHLILLCYDFCCNFAHLE